MTLDDPSVWLRAILATLATWRLTHLLANEDGPADVIVHLRARLGSSIVGRLMDCFACLSLWVAAAMACFLTRQPLDWLLTALALSGAALLLERSHAQPLVIETAASDPSHSSSGEPP